MVNTKGMDQPGKVANPASGQLNKPGKMFFSLFTFAPETSVSRDGFGSPVPRQPAHIYTINITRLKNGVII